MAVVKKKKGNTSVQQALADWKKKSEIRGRLAIDAFNAQPEKAQMALERIRDNLMLGATGAVRVYPDGKKQQSVLCDVEMEYVEHNALWIATEILKDLAMMDIRVANYKFPEVYCAECGEKIQKPKKKAKGK